MRLVRFWERQAWTDKTATRISQAVRKVTGNSEPGKRTADFLHGTWLGHPLHPMLTDVPVGAWTVASLLDGLSLLRKGPPPRAAAQAIGLGILASVPTAASGLMDWSYLRGPAKRTGSGHAMLNTVALTCYGVSLAARLAGRDGRLASFLGLGFVGASAYLGGHLVYGNKVGVNREPASVPALDRVDAAGLNELAEGQLHRVDVGDFPVVLYRTASRVYALGDICPHMGCSLSEGSVQTSDLVCPCHGSTFSLEDGHIVNGPSAYPATVLTAEIAGDRILLSTPT